MRAKSAWAIITFGLLLAVPSFGQTSWEAGGSDLVLPLEMAPYEGIAAVPPRRISAAEELRVEEHQRILRVMPNFNTTNSKDAEPLSAGQKFNLAFKSASDPFMFVAASLDAALGQAQNSFPGYGQGGQGYAKRVGAAYADSFSGTILGNAFFPVLLHQDPRYFRKGTGSFSERLTYAVASTFRCKNDSGNWAPNYSNLLGNLAAGGLANLYYPTSDRGGSLTVERALTVAAEGAIGAVFIEFWPDISRKISHRHGNKSL